MNAIKYFVFLLFVAVASGMAMEHKECLMDPWGKVREMCRDECGLTKEQMKEGDKDLQKVRKFLVCLGNKLGTMNKDGSINREVLLKTVAPMCPLVIAKPIMICCMDRVYKGKCPNPHEIDVLAADFATCWKKMLPNSMWNVMGVLEPPVYPCLDKCKKW